MYNIILSQWITKFVECGLYLQSINIFGTRNVDADEEHLPSERVLTVWGNLADFIIAVKVMISVRSSLLQPVQSPFIRRIRCF